MAVALTLVRLKLTLLRRSMTGSRGAWMVAGAVAGTGLAVSTIVLAALYRASPAILGDLLGVVSALGACPQRPARGPRAGTAASVEVACRDGQMAGVTDGVHSGGLR